MLSIRFALYYPHSASVRVEAALPHNLREFCTNDDEDGPEELRIPEGVFCHDSTEDKGVHSIFPAEMSIDDDSDADFPTLTFEPLALTALAARHTAEIEYLTRIHATVLKALGRSADARRVKLEWRAIVTDVDGSDSSESPEPVPKKRAKKPVGAPADAPVVNVPTVTAPVDTPAGAPAGTPAKKSARRTKK